MSLPDSLLDEVEASLPETPWERAARYERLGLKPREAEELASAPWASLFDELAPPPELARRVAGALSRRIRQRWRESSSRELPEAARFAPVVAALPERAPLIGALDDLFLHLLRNPERSAAELLEPLMQPENGAVEARVADCVEHRDSLRRSEPESVLRWAMGRAFPLLRGRVEPTVVRTRLIEALELEVAP